MLVGISPTSAVDRAVTASNITHPVCEDLYCEGTFVIFQLWIY